MHPPTLHLLAQCTDRKRVVARRELQMREFSQREMSARHAAWESAIGHSDAASMAARDLYVGPHWSTVKRVESAGTSAGFASVRLWVLSAGYGLLAADAQVKPYSATLATGVPDSVVRRSDGDRRSSLRSWWSLLSTPSRERRRAFRSIESLAVEDASACFLLIASPAYVEAIEADVAAARSRIVDPKALVIVTGNAVAAPALSANIVRSGEALIHTVGGARTSLHARVALHLVASLCRPQINARVAQKRYESLTQSAPPAVRHDRAPQTDRDVSRFIAGAIRHDPSATHSRLLREFRSRGLACEQSRFRDLFTAVRGRA